MRRNLISGSNKVKIVEETQHKIPIGPKDRKSRLANHASQIV